MSPQEIPEDLKPILEDMLGLQRRAYKALCEARSSLLKSMDKWPQAEQSKFFAAVGMFHQVGSSLEDILNPDAAEIRPLDAWLQ